MINQKEHDEGVTMGRKAFVAGQMAIPAHDVNFMCTLINRDIGDPRTSATLNGWMKGWHEANVAAPVEAAA